MMVHFSLATYIVLDNLFGATKEDETRVSTKWLNLLRKICAIFVQIFLRTFALFLRMKRNGFCAIFLRNLRKTGNIFLQKLRMKRNFSFAQFAQTRKFYAKCPFLGTLSKIDNLCLELNN